MLLKNCIVYDFMPSHPLNLLVSCQYFCFASLMRFGSFFFLLALILDFLVIMLKPRGSGLYAYANTAVCLDPSVGVSARSRVSVERP